MSSIDAEIERSHFKTLTLAYMSFVRQNRGNGPKTIEEFEQYVGDNYDAYLKRNEISLSDLFISPRDGQPFVFVLKQKRGSETGEVVAYEQEGVGGRRLVGDRSGTVEELDEELFQRMLSGNL